MNQKCLKKELKEGRNRKKKKLEIKNKQVL